MITRRISQLASKGALNEISNRYRSHSRDLLVNGYTFTTSTVRTCMAKSFNINQFSTSMKSMRDSNDIKDIKDLKIIRESMKRYNSHICSLGIQSNTPILLLVPSSQLYKRNYSTKFTASAREGGQKRNRLTNLYLTKKHYYIIGSIIFLGICLFIHYFFPDHSLIDYILKYAYGGPYRDYVLLTRGVFLDKLDDTDSFKSEGDNLDALNDSLDKQPTKIYVPSEMHFEIEIPEHFIHPGLVLTEDTTYKTKGWFSMTDPLQQNLFVEWKDIMQHLNENEQTKYTPMDELLKGCAFMYAKELQDILGEKNVHIQRSEYISMRNTEQHLNPIPTTRENEKYGDMVCLVSRINNPYKKEEKWEGDIWFLHTPYVFHIRLSYPSSLSKLANGQDSQDTQATQERLQKLASKISRNSDYQEQIIKKITITNNPTEISKMLRNQLIEIYLKNKFKRHGSVEVRTIPKKNEDKEPKEAEKKKGWFW